MYSITQYSIPHVKRFSVPTLWEAYYIKATSAAIVEHSGVYMLLVDLQAKIIKHLREKLAHGAGIDDTWRLTFADKLTIKAYNSYHAMDVSGMYCGWVDFTVTFRLDKSGVLNSSDVEIDENMVDEIMEDYPEMDEDEETSAPYLDDLDNYLWEQIFVGVDFNQV